MRYVSWHSVPWRCCCASSPAPPRLQAAMTRLHLWRPRLTRDRLESSAAPVDTTQSDQNGNGQGTTKGTIRATARATTRATIGQGKATIRATAKATIKATTKALTKGMLPPVGHRTICPVRAPISTPTARHMQARPESTTPPRSPPVPTIRLDRHLQDSPEDSRATDLEPMTRRTQRPVRRGLAAQMRDQQNAATATSNSANDSSAPQGSATSQDASSEAQCIAERRAEYDHDRGRRAADADDPRQRLRRARRRAGSLPAERRLRDRHGDEQPAAVD